MEGQSPCTAVTQELAGHFVNWTLRHADVFFCHMTSSDITQVLFGYFTNCRRRKVALFF